MKENNAISSYGEENLLETESKAFSKQSHQFWTLQIAGWLGYATVVIKSYCRNNEWFFPFLFTVVIHS